MRVILSEIRLLPSAKAIDDFVCNWDKERGRQLPDGRRLKRRSNKCPGYPMLVSRHGQKVVAQCGTRSPLIGGLCRKGGVIAKHIRKLAVANHEDRRLAKKFDASTSLSSCVQCRHAFIVVRSEIFAEIDVGEERMYRLSIVAHGERSSLKSLRPAALPWMIQLPRWVVPHPSLCSLWCSYERGIAGQGRLAAKQFLGARAVTWRRFENE